MTTLDPVDFDYYADEAPDAMYELLMAGDDGVIPTVADLLVAARPAWHQQAACRGIGPEVFYIGQGGDPRPARALCAGCPVATDCYDAGLDEPVGVWAGLSPQQRKKARRNAPPAA